MPFSSIAGVALSALFVLSATVGVVSAQTELTSQVIITTQLGSGVVAPSVLPTVTVQTNGPSFSTVPTVGTTTLSYPSNFMGEVRTVTFVPGNYLVTASSLGQYVTYSQDCAGTTAVGAVVRNCVVTLVNTPPSLSPCSGYGYGCVATVIPYIGPTTQNKLSCSPAYQTVAVGQPAVFVATGGTGGYNWTTADRTFLNAGSTLSTVLQSVGMQTVIVSNGVQTATCTVTVTNNGTAVLPYQDTTSVTPLSLVSTYTPALLPNTGFEPLSAQAGQGGASFAFAVVAVLGAGIFFYPYVKKALVVAVR
ncbi:MAG: hypothetical protein Q7S26_02205 [bacterium]|nr:hypothetical protein [bacterium]